MPNEWLAIHHQYTPVMLEYIPYMDPMGSYGYEWSYKPNVTGGALPRRGRFFERLDGASNTVKQPQILFDQSI